MGKTPIDHKREEEKREIIIMMSQIGGKKDTQPQYKYYNRKLFVPFVCFT